MKKSTDNYLINKLIDGNNLNIVLLSHNAYWPEIQKLDNHFENCNVVVFGNSTSYIKLADIQRRNKIGNSDLIIFYSSEFYNEKELAELKDRDVSDEKVQELVHNWRMIITKNFYNCSIEIFSGLADMYIYDERFTKNIDKYGEGFTNFLSEAMKYYCDTN